MKSQEKLGTEEKIIKCAKGFKIASRVLYIISCVFCFVAIVLAIVLPLTCKFTKYTSVEVALILVGIALYCFFLIGTLWNVERVFFTIEQTKSAFGEAVTKYVKKTAIFIIMLSIIPALIQTVLVAIFANGSDVNTPVQIGGVIAGIVLYMLGYFFQFGAELKNKNKNN